ncbi:9066_t:CDS:2, partial [Paraglomus occultum]
SDPVPMNNIFREYIVNLILKQKILVLLNWSLENCGDYLILNFCKEYKYKAVPSHLPCFLVTIT